MNNSFITPIQIMNIPGTTSNVGQVTGQGGANLFKDVFQNAINNVIDTDNELSKQQYLLATGQIDDAHTVPIAAAEAQLSVDLLVQLRNKALESYNQLINIGI